MKKSKNSILVFFNIISYFATIAVWLAIPESLVVTLGATLFSLVGTTALIFLNRRQFKNFYSSNYFKKFIEALVGCFLIFCILGLVNYLGYKNPVNFDLTKNKSNSLTEQSTKVVMQFKSTINVKVFGNIGEYTQIKALLDLYRQEKHDFNVEFIDAELRPDLVGEYGISRAPSIVIEYGNKRQIVEELSELKITNALITLSRKESPIVYYLKSNQTVDMESDAKGSGSFLKKIIINSNFDIRFISSKAIESIDTTKPHVLIIWGPRESFFEQDVKAIEQFLSKGGHLLVSIDPQFKNDNVTILREALKKFGILIENNLIIDRLKNAKGSSGTVPLVHQFNNSHPITKDLKEGVFFPITSSVSGVKDNKRSELLEPLGLSSPYPAAWADINLDDFGKGKIEFSDPKDEKGPVSYFSAIENPALKSKIVAFGNSTFVTNNFQKFPRNFSLFLNCLKWLAGEDELISFNLPVLKDSPVFMSENQMGVIFYFSVVFAPLVLFTLAFIMYRRRRRL